MTFQNPAILYGLALAALPLIIHLINLRKYRKMYFSSLWFLKNIQYQTRRSRKIHEWIILLLRTLLIASLVMAFAGPIITTNTNKKSQALHLIVDNTLSMQGSNQKGNLFDQAKTKAYEVCDALETNQRVNIHFTAAANSQWELSPQQAKEVLSAAEPSHGARKINSIVKNIYKKSNIAPNLVILSDFQKNILQPDTIFRDSTLSINIVKYSNESHNISIDTMWFESPLQIPGQNAMLNILIKNHANDEINELPVKVEINGELLSAGTVSIDPMAQKVYKTTVEIEDLGQLKITALVDDNPLSFDNNYYSGVNISSKVKIIETGAKPSPYLKALYDEPGFFEHEFLPADNIPLSEINQAQTIIVHQPVEISPGLGNAIAQAIPAGKNILIIPQVKETPAEINQLLETLRLPQIDKTIEDSTTIKEINVGHPLFNNAIEAFDEQMNLPAIENYYQLASESSYTPVIYNDLNQAVLFHMKRGNGNVYMFTFDALKRQFATHALFVPLFYNAASIRNKNTIPSITSNEPGTIKLTGINKRGDSPIKIRHKKGEFIPYMYKNPNATILAVRENQITRPGFYDIVLEDSIVNLLAVNHQKDESKMDFYGSETLLNQVFNYGLANNFDIDAAAEEILNPVQKLWRYFIIIALIMIISEIALIYFKEKSYKT
ncbi:MAG TPA: BatA domain-containing protein [Salinivirga sp.]|uniref:BatA domain-containing protein n=1 Tax=Salinivirga sp. TaxID=1970192 RepID=UPI002B46AEEB|nr:BatA domain-containing protein [Salinivirga sp.]HKK59426.1 BatA domain-containing protein [Salinivirga sp.]